MVIFKHKTFGLRGVLIALAVVSCLGLGAVFFIAQSQSAVQAYDAHCVTQACREAADAAAAAEQAAASAAASAQTLEGEVERLNAEIAALEADIAANQAIANDLAAQIGTNEEKLGLQQAALAKLLVNMHFEDEPDAILLLAGSSSLGDYAERQSRQNTAKTQVAASAEAVRELKEELEAQKAKVDDLIASSEFMANEATTKRNQQNALKEKYQNDSEAYARDAVAAREKMQEEIRAEMRHTQGNGTVGNGYNTYPFAGNCPGDDSMYIVIGGYVCQCVSYTAWKVQEFWGIYISNWGNASDWGRYAAANGYVVDNNPTPFSVGYSEAGYYGHVVWVESVNGNGTINLTEYNNAYSAASGQWGDFGARNNVPASGFRYIHFDQRTR